MAPKEFPAPVSTSPCRGHGGVACLLAAVTGLLLALSTVACAAGVTVAVIRGHSFVPYEEVMAGFTAAVKQRHESASFVTLEEEPDRQALEARIALIRPDLIYCLDLKALERAAHIRHIPKVFSLIAYSNLESYLERKDISGVSLDIAPATQFNILRQAFPAGRRLGVLYDPKHNRLAIEDAKKMALAAGFSLVPVPVGSIKELPFALEKLETGADLLWTLYDQTVYSPEAAKYVLMQSLQRRIPAVGFSPHFARAGALLALYGDYPDMGQQAALQALAVLGGAGESIVRMSRPRTVRIAVNEKVERFLGMSFSPSFRKTVHQFF